MLHTFLPFKSLSQIAEREWQQKGNSKGNTYVHTYIHKIIMLLEAKHFTYYYTVGIHTVHIRSYVCTIRLRECSYIILCKIDCKNCSVVNQNQLNVQLTKLFIKFQLIGLDTWSNYFTQWIVQVICITCFMSKYNRQVI